jgi:hypothetical protein
MIALTPRRGRMMLARPIQSILDESALEMEIAHTDATAAQAGGVFKMRGEL